MIRGSCCCGAVQFELTALPNMMGACHCSRCRKLGSNSILFTKLENFHLLQGQAFIASYMPEPPFHYVRNFCKQCGTSLGGIGSNDASFPIPINSLDDDPVLRHQFHVFVGSKPAWYEICDQAPQFLENPPD